MKKNNILNRHNINLKIFSSEVSEDKIQIIKNSLYLAYGDILTISIGRELDLPENAYDSKRHQYNAYELLRKLLANKDEELLLLVLSKDIYVPGMNFIFGLAQYKRGAVLSLYRLSNADLIGKEAVHEIGHTLGLNHCDGACVMQFSNSLLEAINKPNNLCENCRKKLGINYQR